MQTPGPYSTKIGRFVSVARIGLSAAALVILLFDPNQPTQYQQLGYGILIAYVVWSGAVAVFVHGRTWLRPAQEIIIYAVDVPVIAFIMVLTEGDTSPFFVFFTFIIIAGMLRWAWQGVVLATVAVLVIFMFITLAFDEQIDIGPVAIRTLYLCIMATMLSMIAAHLNRARAELARLSGPTTELTGSHTPTGSLLSYAADVFQAPRAILVWSDAEEPWTYVAVHNSQGCDVQHTKPEELLQSVNSELIANAFLCSDAADPGGLVLVKHGSALTTWNGLPLSSKFQSQFDLKSLVTAPIKGETVEGRIFILDPPDLNSDQLLVVQVVAEQVTRRMELNEAIRQLQRSSAQEERVRIGRDIHDGVLQLLAGASIQLQSMRRLVGNENGSLAKQIEALQQSIAPHQRMIRDFVDALKPMGTASPDAEPLALALASLAEELRKQWHIEVRWSVNPNSAQVAADTIIHVRHMLAEATANARRHGKATMVTVAAEVRGDHLDVTIGDNGTGFPVKGRWTLDELKTLNLGPVMLRERVQAVRGNMVLESKANASVISVSLPLKKAKGDNADSTVAG
jgi:signal transduction histidine kinase